MSGLESTCNAIIYDVFVGIIVSFLNLEIRNFLYVSELPVIGRQLDTIL